MLKVKTVSRMLLAGAVSLPLAACYTATEEVDQLSARQSGGTGYDQALTREYRDLASYEAYQMYDWGDARHFAKKGLTAAEGARPVPERVADWDLAYGARRLSDARKRLVALLARDAASRSPELAARAQASYDCWLEQLEEGWQADHIAACHDRFQKSVISLERELSEPQRVWFSFNRAEPNDHFKAEIARLARESVRLNVPLVTVVGYADTVGSQENNMKISLRRADRVKQILMENGIPEDRIAISAYGEDRLKVKTRDNVREAQNRRVEIIFYPRVDA
ncbi:OmpA family protein [Aestuariispira insulae]|uniref:OOP family OmpA-OmpF porin n=1 Tax=Aestuariispira insulae TaxID=1461337 RepID=A0A3D9H9L8_9PROT|nr:OmpA family protein [Aestuariispira insulae]RED46169.1 OOP family OmpA-OmpF porin [Aestuariispira insulae]